MDWLPFTLDTVEMFLLMFTRVIAIMLLLPIFGSANVPIQVRIGLSLLLTVVLFSSMPAAHAAVLPAHHSIGMMVFLIVKELAIGLIMGYTTLFLFAAVHFAGRLVDTEMAFSLVELVDPLSEEQVTVMGQLWVLVFSIILLTINGHYFFLLAVQKSFELIPVLGLDLEPGRLMSHFFVMTGNIFILSLKMAAPIYVTLILTLMALGVVARTVPQINIFFVGLPMKIMVGIATTVIVLPLLGTLFRKIFEGLIQDIWAVLYMMA
ncbi:MAG: flagellar biosynthetic protein FliR [Chitinispirillaceae bacterium]|nr:flagellar biosynthetic protein FliR [Chitinispirillaceae bacterium]